jgi:hypothetical protein
MGHSETATYIRMSEPEAVKSALAKIIARHGFQPSRDVPLDFVPPYTPLAEIDSILLWMERASPGFHRIYSSHPGIFAIHDGTYIPILQQLAASLRTDAFEISVDDGDSLCLLETDGEKSRLTGCHSYVMDEIWESKRQFKTTPGEILTFRGLKFPYQNLQVDAELVPEVITYEFGNDMETAISDFEASVFGQRLPSEYEFLSDEFDVRRTNEFGFRREV